MVVSRACGFKRDKHWQNHTNYNYYWATPIEWAGLVVFDPESDGVLRFGIDCWILDTSHCWILTNSLRLIYVSACVKMFDYSWQQRGVKRTGKYILTKKVDTEQHLRCITGSVSSFYAIAKSKTPMRRDKRYGRNECHCKMAIQHCKAWSHNPSQKISMKSCQTRTLGTNSITRPMSHAQTQKRFPLRTQTIIRALNAQEKSGNCNKHLKL